MAQLVVRNLPEDVKKRLQRRAEKHGRSLEAEVRAILAQTPEAGVAGSEALGAGTALAKKLAKHQVEDADWQAFEDKMQNLRKTWRARKVKLG